MNKINISFIKKFLPKRVKQSSKIDGGKVLIVGGRKGLFGAGILASLAATRTGAGYTHLMTDVAKYPWMKYPDFVVHSYSLTTLKKHSESVIGIGPGLGLTYEKRKLLSFLAKNKIAKVVVDGDALTLLSRMTILKLPTTWILTPHEGELARLLGVKSLEIKKDRFKYVQAAQKKYGCIVILKGAENFIATSKKVFVTSSGTKALAKAGTGDVLLGMISACYAQGLDPINAAIVGTYIHGYASKLWINKSKDYLGMRPLDLIDEIPFAIYQIRKS